MKTSIEINLDDDLLFELFMLAHKKDITFNQLVENILREFMENHQ
tara:strand:- start:584 stop:718 length:135 start_codon:yes stop_codon:yes gene_type:complete